MSTFNRRFFLRASGISALPVFAPFSPAIAAASGKFAPAPGIKMVNFVSDGPIESPEMYIDKLHQINRAQPIVQDFYGNGGAVEALEKKFAEITGKQKAIFMPSGTMANQLAIHVLCGENPKVFLQETSHVYRDEADAAQSLFNKRLIPLGKGQTGFSADELKEAVEYHRKGEVFASGIGAIAIENPVRRTDGRMISIDELRKISSYCREQGFRLHLDGARLYMAAAWSGVSIAEYSSLFDTVYISLYKYLGASAGAILCGDKTIIDKMPHLIKIHGGTMFGNWSNAAPALYTLNGFDERLQQSRKRAEELIGLLNKLPELKINALPGGTNIYFLQLQKTPKPEFARILMRDHNIRLGRPDDTGKISFAINETILYKPVQEIVDGFKAAFSAAG